MGRQDLSERHLIIIGRNKLNRLIVFCYVQLPGDPKLHRFFVAVTNTTVLLSSLLVAIIDLTFRSIYSLDRTTSRSLCSKLISRLPKPISKQYSGLLSSAELFVFIWNCTNPCQNFLHFLVGFY